MSSSSTPCSAPLRGSTTSVTRARRLRCLELALTPRARSRPPVRLSGSSLSAVFGLAQRRLRAVEMAPRDLHPGQEHEGQGVVDRRDLVAEETFRPRQLMLCLGVLSLRSKRHAHRQAGIPSEPTPVRADASRSGLRLAGVLRGRRRSAPAPPRRAPSWRERERGSACAGGPSDRRACGPPSRQPRGACPRSRGRGRSLQAHRTTPLRSRSAQSAPPRVPLAMPVVTP